MCVANVKLYEDSAAVKCSASYTLYSVCARGHITSNDLGHCIMCPNRSVIGPEL